MRIRTFCNVVDQLDQKTQELSEVQKNVVELRCEMDTERSKWLSDKSQLQADLDGALKDRDEEREKAAQLNAEVRHTHLQALSHVTVSINLIY